MKTLGAFVFAWICCVICYAQFMTWYDSWCRRNDREYKEDRE